LAGQRHWQKQNRSRINSPDHRRFFISRNTPSRCIFFLRTRSAWSTLLSLTVTYTSFTSLHDILDTSADGDDSTMNDLMINGHAARLALADWMQPLPRQTKS
jgi:hypothetical protein